MTDMRKILILLFVLCATIGLSAQTLRMTTVHIGEQKKLQPLNNHIIAGGGAYTYKDYDNGNRVGPFFQLGYYKTDIIMNNTIGLYLNLSSDCGIDSYTIGVLGGATYKLLEIANDQTLYLLGGLGWGLYDSYAGYSYYRDVHKNKLRIEAGALFNYKRFDIKVSTGYPDFIALGFGYKFGFN